MKRYEVHDLIQIKKGQQAVFDRELPFWVQETLKESNWAVVRRGIGTSGIPVGIRGELKTQRFACELARDAVGKTVKPDQLLRDVFNGRIYNPLWEKELAPLKRIVWDQENNWKGILRVGVTGSVGYELATGIPVTTEKSDIDLLIYVEERFSRSEAKRLLQFLKDMERRTDAVLKMEKGWISLEEYVSEASQILVKSIDGCCMIVHENN